MLIVVLGIEGIKEYIAVLVAEIVEFGVKADNGVVCVGQIKF